MTDTETHYSQMEKELLAVVFARNRVKDYILSNKQVTVEADHQPLVSIKRKPLSAVSARLHMMIMRLKSFDIKLVYKKGQDMPIADMLSRAYFLDCHVSELEADDCVIVSSVSITDFKYSELQGVSASDASPEN